MHLTASEAQQSPARGRGGGSPAGAPAITCNKNPPAHSTNNGRACVSPISSTVPSMRTCAPALAGFTFAPAQPSARSKRMVVRCWSSPARSTPEKTRVAASARQNYTTGFDILEILVLGGQSHLFRRNTSTGETHLRVLNDGGSGGSAAISGISSTVFIDFEFFTCGGNTFLSRDDAATGAARINRTDGWRAATVGTGAFDPSTTGWTDM